MRFFSELTVRVDANASTFLKVIRSLLQHSNQFIADTLFRKMEETKTLALQRSQLDGTQDGPKISLFTSGIINFCLEILDKCCDQDPRDSHEINEDLNNLGCDPMIVASSFILKILSLENIVFSKRMKSVSSNGICDFSPSV